VAINSTNSIQGSGALRDLAVRITKQMDQDGDGKLSTTEFTNFLSSFFSSMSGLSGTTGTTKDTATSPATTTAAATPAATTALDIPTRPAVGTMAGFDYYKMIDKSGCTTVKYTVGRILQGFPNTPEGLRQALPDLQKFVPGLKIVGNDKLDFGEYVSKEGQRIGVIDVIEAATETTGKAWQWLPQE
jgi:hypothetical protein